MWGLRDLCAPTAIRAEDLSAEPTTIPKKLGFDFNQNFQDILSSHRLTVYATVHDIAYKTALVLLSTCLKKT